MVRTRRDVNPTFDDPDSFSLNIKTGVIRANIGDIGSFLNAGGVANSPLRNITLLADGDQIKLKGTLHKLISLPVELFGSVAATPDNRIQLHVTKLNVLKIPFKGLLGGLHIMVADLFHPQGIPGTQGIARIGARHDSEGLRACSLGKRAAVEHTALQSE